MFTHSKTLTIYDILKAMICGEVLFLVYYKRLRELREDHDKTQQEIADVLGTTYQYYSAYERGLRDIPFQRVIILAEYYSVSLDYIAELTNNPSRNIKEVKL